MTASSTGPALSLAAREVGDATLEYALERAEYYERWRGRLWCAHLSVTGVSAALAVFVPFGIAALATAPVEWRLSINLLTLAASCISLVLYFVDQVQRLPDRALLLKRLASELNHSICLHRDGLLSREELGDILSAILKQHADGDGV